ALIRLSAQSSLVLPGNGTRSGGSCCRLLTAAIPTGRTLAANRSNPGAGLSKALQHFLCAFRRFNYSRFSALHVTPLRFTIFILSNHKSLRKKIIFFSKKLPLPLDKPPFGFVNLRL